MPNVPRIQSGPAAPAQQAPTAVENLSARARLVLGKQLTLSPEDVEKLATQLNEAGAKEQRARIEARGLEVFGVVEPSAEVKDLVEKLGALAQQLRNSTPPGLERL